MCGLGLGMTINDSGRLSYPACGVWGARGCAATFALTVGISIAIGYAKGIDGLVPAAKQVCEVDCDRLFRVLFWVDVCGGGGRAAVACCGLGTVSPPDTGLPLRGPSSAPLDAMGVLSCWVVHTVFMLVVVHATLSSR
jgi:hypothetical protein